MPANKNQRATALTGFPNIPPRHILVGKWMNSSVWCVICLLGSGEMVKLIVWGQRVENSRFHDNEALAFLTEQLETQGWGGRRS